MAELEESTYRVMWEVECDRTVDAIEKQREAEERASKCEDIVAIVHACYEATRSLSLHSTAESDLLWEHAERLMRLVAKHRGEEWKLVPEEGERA